jgi:hypothetical protein
MQHNQNVKRRYTVKTVLLQSALLTNIHHFHPHNYITALEHHSSQHTPKGMLPQYEKHESKDYLPVCRNM